MQTAPSRNAPCPCGSGKKYKRCCGQADQPPATGATPTDKLQQVISLYQQGKLQAAGHFAEQLLRNNPDDATLLEISAVIAMQLGNPELAIERFNRQLERQPGHALAHSNLCMVLHSVGRDEDAYPHGQQAILLDPKLADAWNNLGNIYKSGSKLDKALAHYEKALALDGSDPRVHVNAGSVSQLLGDLETAESRYRSALHIHPGFASAYSNLGAVLQRQQRHEEAEQAYRQALKLEPDNPEILVNYGSFLLERNVIDRAREQLDRAIRIDPNNVGAHVTLGNLHDRLRDWEQVNKHYNKALLLDPANSTVHCNLGYRCYDLGKQQEAVEHFEHARKGDPHSAKALAGLGNCMLRQDETDQAEEYIEKALKLSPWDVYAHIAKAELDAQQRNTGSAEAEWKHVIEHHPDMSEGYIGLAKHYSDAGRYDEARMQYLAAEEAEAASLRLYNAWSNHEEKLHHLDEAERLAEKALAINPAYPGLAILQSKLARRRKDFSAALERLDTIDSAAIESEMFKSSYLFELGDVLDKLGRYPEAYAAYDSANQAKNIYLGRVYEAETDNTRFKHWKQFYSADNMAALSALPRPENTSKPTPVFIVGFPRSGTSLLEQIIGSHPLAAPAGELLFIGDISQTRAQEITGSELSYPDLLLDEAAPLDAQKLQAMRDYYLCGVESLGVTDSNTRWVTDKMPHNALHVGLISVLFPEAPIIHISRHPFNSCLSAYFSNFKSGHRYTSSLESTAQHYKHIMDMLAHYRNIGIKYMEVHYEDLVTDQENITRKILEYIGMPWDDACLQHHKSARVVKTASYEQVTQKIYTSSLYRYRNYHEAVQPLIPILKTTIEHFGYTID
jgi:tetratricopeptide (TPR) repeat protein